MQKLLSWREKLLKYGALAILITVPLYPKFPFFRIPGTYVAIRLEDFLIFFVALIWIIGIVPTYKNFFKDKITKAFIIFGLVSLLSLISGIFLTQTVTWHIGFFHWLRRIEYFMAFFIGFAAIKRKSDIQLFVKTLGLVILVATIYGASQRYFNGPIITTQNNEYSKGIALRYTPGAHIASTFAGHYDLATFLVLVMPILFTSFFVTKMKDLKYLFGLASLGGLWLLVVSISRISIVSYLLGVSLALILIKKYKALAVVIALSVIFFLFSPDLVGRYYKLIHLGAQRMAIPEVFAKEQAQVVPKLEDRSTSIRLNVEWPRAIRAFMKNPLLGTGFSSITLATDSHYLRLLGELGILGFVAFFIIIIRIGKHFLMIISGQLKTDENGAFLAGVIGAFPAVLLNAVFIDVFEASKFATIFWLIIGFSWAVVKINQHD